MGISEIVARKCLQKANNNLPQAFDLYFADDYKDVVLQEFPKDVRFHVCLTYLEVYMCASGMKCICREDRNPNDSTNRYFKLKISDKHTAYTCQAKKPAAYAHTITVYYGKKFTHSSSQQPILSITGPTADMDPELQKVHCWKMNMHALKITQALEQSMQSVKPTEDADLKRAIELSRAASSATAMEIDSVVHTKCISGLEQEELCVCSYRLQGGISLTAEDHELNKVLLESIGMAHSTGDASQFMPDNPNNRKRQGELYDPIAWTFKSSPDEIAGLLD